MAIYRINIKKVSRKAPSTISGHLKRLCEDGILVVHHEKYPYRITKKELVNLMLDKYKEDFTDKVVNNFVLHR